MLPSRGCSSNTVRMSTLRGQMASPLSTFRAAIGGNAEIVPLLCLHEADVDKVDACGRTSLQVVANEGHYAVAQVLLAARADVRSRSDVDDDAALY